MMSASRKRNVALGIVRRLRAKGYIALFAGGCVRDELLGCEPGDYDVATSARPEQVQALFPRNVPVGVSFGVILVIESNVQVEVVTFRADAAYVDGRHPESVRFTTPQEDASRRDFTVNGMFEDPETGEVIDYVGGREDLERRIIRAIGDPTERFREDRLRLVRAVRFASRLDFVIEPVTAVAIHEMAPGIQQISKERVGAEIVKILVSGRARRGFELLDSTGLLGEILPEMIGMKNVDTGLALEQYDLSPRREELANTPGEDARHHLEALGFAVLLHEVAKSECRREEDGKIAFADYCEPGAERTVEICSRLRRPNVVGARAAELVRKQLQPLNAPEMRTAMLKKFLRQEEIHDLLELSRIRALAVGSGLEHYDFCREALGRFSVETLKPPPLVDGGDLISLGHRPGPRFREILSAIEDGQLDGKLLNREAAFAFIRERFPLR